MALWPRAAQLRAPKRHAPPHVPQTWRACPRISGSPPPKREGKQSCPSLAALCVAMQAVAKTCAPALRVMHAHVLPHQSTQLAQFAAQAATTSWAGAGSDWVLANAQAQPSHVRELLPTLTMTRCPLQHICSSCALPSSKRHGKLRTGLPCMWPSTCCELACPSLDHKRVLIPTASQPAHGSATARAA